MEIFDIENWNRKQHYNHFSKLKDPYFDVTKAYHFSKEKKISFFGRYLHDCMKAINDIDELKLRINNSVVEKHEVINASATIMRQDNTFGFSFINFDENLDVFLNNLENEKQRINSTTDLFPPVNGLDCIHCSALPWLSFSGHKEPVSGEIDSVPKLAFSKIVFNNDKIEMNVAINVNHALVDGYHVSLFAEKFQYYLNK